MVARLRPRAWACWLAGVLISFSYLEEAGFRSRWVGHPTLSRFLARWLARLGRNVARALGMDPNVQRRWLGPALFAFFWGGIAVHIALTDAD